jgi:hydroxymethylpyrimidine pyrophosphatase-like HAD family hydrolase
MDIKKIADNIDALSTTNRKFNQKLTNRLVPLIKRYNKLMMSEDVYQRARVLTKPLNKIWVNSWLNSLSKHIDDNPFKEPGVYIGTGGTGAGKSSLAFELMERWRLKTGKGSYVTTKLEKPRFDERVGRHYVYHNLKPLNYFFHKKIKVRPNHHKYASMQIDEAHFDLNYRKNGSNEYNDIFIPLQKYAIGVRHTIKYIFLWTQMRKVDTQLMALAKKVFDVQVHKGFNYQEWMENGVFKITILGWWVTFYKLIPNGNNSFNRYEVGKYYIERTCDLTYFDTFNLENSMNDIPMDKFVNYGGKQT